MLPLPSCGHLQHHISFFFYGQMVDFIEANFFFEQRDRVKQLADYIMTLGRIGAGSLGEYHFDKLTLSRDGGDN